MLDKVFALADITKSAISNPAVLEQASVLVFERDTMTQEDFTLALFQYSALLSSVCTTLSTELLLDSDELAEILKTVEMLTELDELG